MPSPHRDGILLGRLKLADPASAAVGFEADYMYTECYFEPQAGSLGSERVFQHEITVHKHYTAGYFCLLLSDTENDWLTTVQPNVVIFLL